MNEDVPQTWYFTFGAGHAHPDGFFVVRQSKARGQMVARFGVKWAFQYDEAEWVGSKMEEKYRLTEVKL